jgi:hypothetical protein
MTRLKDLGTYCGMIKKQLITAHCPLPSKCCMWKHRIHGYCTYKDSFRYENISPNQYAKHVGLPPISEKSVNKLRSKVIFKIRKEFTT